MRRKRVVLFAALGLAMAAVLLCSEEAAQAARQGLALCAQSVIPALFPFFVLSTLFTTLGYASAVGRLLARPAQWLFHAPGVGGAALFLGLLGGYPIGARTVGQLYREGQCSRDEGERLLAFCNNCSPSFVLGIVGSAVFASPRIGFLLYLIHALSAIITGIVLRPRAGVRRAMVPIRREAVPFSRALVGAIQSGANGMLAVCAAVVFFQVVLQLVVKFTGLSHGAFVGFWELVNGVLRLGCGKRDFIWSAALLGWGGLSVHAQTAAALCDTDLSLRYHLLGKLLQAGISFALAFLVAMWL